MIYKKKDLSSNLPSYESPPIHEVVYGMTLEHLIKFKAAYLGFFWSEIKKEFPNIEEVPYIFPNIPEVNIDEYSFKRTWFIDKTGNYLLQLQNDRFIFNWRSLDENDVYPRHNVVMDKFKTCFERFNNFITKHQLGEIVPKAYELTYINHIKVGDGWENVSEIGNIIKGFDWSDVTDFFNDPEFISINYGFTIPNNYGRLRIKINPGIRKSDSKPILILEISATNSVSEESKYNIDDWFATAREKIVKSFECITTDEIQSKLWKKIENK